MSFASSSSLAGDICPESSYRDPSDPERLTQVEGHDQDEYTTTPICPIHPLAMPSTPHFIHFYYHHNRPACNVLCSLLQAIQLLDDLTNFSVDYRCLYQILFLTGLAIQTYEDTPTYFAWRLNPLS